MCFSSFPAVQRALPVSCGTFVSGINLNTLFVASAARGCCCWRVMLMVVTAGCAVDDDGGHGGDGCCYWLLQQQQKLSAEWLPNGVKTGLQKGCDDVSAHPSGKHEHGTIRLKLPAWFFLQCCNTAAMLVSVPT